TQVGRVMVVSAFSGAVLESIADTVQDFNFARLVANAGDLDGDGLDDVSVSAFITGIGNQAWSSGAPHKLWSDAQFPTSLAGIGDANADGVPDVISGNASLQLGSNAHVVSGANGALLAALTNSSPTAFAHVAPLGDTNGNNLPEIVSTSGGSVFAPA